MICCWLTADEAQIVRDLIGPEPRQLAAVAEQLDASARERMLPCGRPALSIWMANGMVEDVFDVEWADAIIAAIRSAHRGSVTLAVAHDDARRVHARGQPVTTPSTGSTASTD